MYEFLSKNITKFFIDKKIIDKSKHEIYEYGFELIFSQTVYILIMIFISVLLNCIIESIVFFLVFIFTENSRVDIMPKHILVVIYFLV